MEDNEIMTNEEVTDLVETAENTVSSDGSGKLKMAAVGGLAVLVGGLATQYLFKPAIAKWKARKRDKDEVVDADYTEVGNEENDSDEDVEEK